MRVVFLGDSLTWGGYGGNYVMEIAKQHPEHDIINAGVSGATVLNLRRRIDDVIEMNPDGVFVMVGGNDSTSYTQPKTRIYYKQVHKIPDGIVTPQMFVEAYRELLNTLNLAFIQTWVGLAPKEYNLVTVKAMIEYNMLVKDIARTMNIPTLDLMAHFKPNTIQDRPEIDMKFINMIGRRSTEGWNDYEMERQRGNFTYTFDGLHLTPESAQAAARSIAAFIGL